MGRINLMAIITELRCNNALPNHTQSTAQLIIQRVLLA